MKKILILGLFSVLLVTGCSIKSTRIKPLNQEQAKAKAEKFINDNLIQPGTTATIATITPEGDLYKLDVSYNNQNIVSYMTKDGTTFFPSGMVVADIEKQTADRKGQTDNAQAAQKQNAPKTDKPSVELFVMSYCPYGTQIEKGIIPAVQALGKTIDFSIKFCDYAMHGQKEVEENLRQTCIQQNEPTKFFSYLSCFLKAGDYASCIKTSGISQSKLDSCYSATDKKYQVLAKFNDKSKWSNGSYPPFDVFKSDNDKYGVQGSPTLVINGAKIESARDSASLLNTICASFNNQPAECQKQVTSAAPAPGFGEGTAASGAANGGCATN